MFNQMMDPERIKLAQEQMSRMTLPDFSRIQQQGTSLLKRVRYCKCCQAYVRGFDHHCPAFGNCIGQNNHALFTALVVGFLSTEASHVVMLSHILGRIQDVEFETSLAVCLVIGTRLFTLLQVLWQVVFLAWHIYCICFNIRTDEWVNWKRYPEFLHFLVDDESSIGGYGEALLWFWYSLWLRWVAVLGVSLIALLVPNFADFLALVGSSVCCALGFVFPALFHLIAFKKEQGRGFVLDSAIIAFGFTVAVSGTWISLLEMLAAKSS